MESEHISIARATPADAKEFSQLVLQSGELLVAIYDNSAQALMTHLYGQPDNLYSYTHSCFLQVDEKKGGMLLAYSQTTERNQQKNTNRLMIEFLKFGYYQRLLRMIKTHRAMGSLEQNEYVISNIAIADTLRNQGLAKILIQEAVRQARQEACSSLVLNVAASNIGAIRCYEKNGFALIKKRPPFKLNGKNFVFCKMAMALQ